MARLDQPVLPPERFWSVSLVVHAGAAAFLALPLASSAILATHSGDPANHVRHVYESSLALAEGQLPPRVAPLLNGARRLPLFQAYSGTAFLVPGARASWLDPYTALRLALVLFSTLGGRGIALGTATLFGEAGTLGLQRGVLEVRPVASTAAALCR